MRVEKLARSRSLTDEVSDALRQQLRSGALKPGDRLPTATGLAAMFGVSVPVIREALAKLRHDGLIETVQGSGSYVAGSPPVALRIDDWADPSDLSSIFEVREMIEGDAARWAAGRRTAAQLGEMRASLDALDRALATGSDGTQADFEFHRRIVESTRNRILIDVASFLSVTFKNSIGKARLNSKSRDGFGTMAQEEHIRIYEAIAARDAEKAQFHAREHVRNIRKRLGI
jgi:GntR family transcriptional repressor for pyruvate dehydrogenase complex